MISPTGLKKCIILLTQNYWWKKKFKITRNKKKKRLKQSRLVTNQLHCIKMSRQSYLQSRLNLLRAGQQRMQISAQSQGSHIKEVLFLLLVLVPH